MNTKLTGEITATFVMGGVSKKTKKPYLQVSDGIEAKFVRLHPDLPFDDDIFSQYERGDEITMTVDADVLSGNVEVVEL